MSELIVDGELIDLPLEGAKFTWTNNQERVVQSRIDRILISKECDDLYTSISQRALPRPISDHNPLLLELGEFSGAPTPFQWDMALCEDLEFDGKIGDWWNSACINGWAGFVICKSFG
ncbi:uncharacterized protein LOC143850510 [Tasmannia lanceolata]|uniref:uncharacterized protein LOC143850510 n=1 Tax=Tasmannia lanceolata TaxID=3420 RepID=UPI004062BA88